jgi:hypothetical protein
VARSPTRAHHPAGLTIAAKRLAEAALEEFGRFGVVVTLDKTGRVHFRSDRRIPPPAAKLAIARHGDLIEAQLIERREIAEARQGFTHLDPPKYSQRVSSALQRPVHPCVHPEKRHGYECEPSNL